MTDNEIIKALECCPQYIMCGHCPFRNVENCMSALYVDALDLINRQKAEIERLTAERDAMHQDVKAAEEYAWRLKTEKDSLIHSYEACQVEVIKEFAERLKENCRVIGAPLITNRIDNLVKEMVGE